MFMTMEPSELLTAHNEKSLPGDNSVIADPPKKFRLSFPVKNFAKVINANFTEIGEEPTPRASD